MRLSKLTSAFLIVFLTAQSLHAQLIPNYGGSGKTVAISPYLMPRIDFIRNTEPVVNMASPNAGVAGGLLMRLFFEEKWGLFAGAGIAKRQLQYSALGTNNFEAEPAGTYNWNANFRHEKLMAEVQAGVSFQKRPKCKSKTCSLFGASCTGWFFVADAGILVTQDFKNEILINGGYERYELNTDGSELISSASYTTFTDESDEPDRLETQVALLLRPAIKYRFQRAAIQFGPELHLGLNKQNDLLDYRSANGYRVHSLGLFVAAEF